PSRDGKTDRAEFVWVLAGGGAGVCTRVVGEKLLVGLFAEGPSSMPSRLPGCSRSSSSSTASERRLSRRGPDAGTDRRRKKRARRRAPSEWSQAIAVRLPFVRQVIRMGSHFGYRACEGQSFREPRRDLK